MKPCLQGHTVGARQKYFHIFNVHLSNVLETINCCFIACRSCCNRLFFLCGGILEDVPAEVLHGSGTAFKGYF